MPSTTPNALGCCAGSSATTSERCITIDDEEQCAIMSSCHWVADAELAECDWATYAAQLDPGCCYIADVSYIGTRWEETCKEYYDEMYCLMPKDTEGQSRCEWAVLTDNPYFECDIFWPTAPPPDGCCAGDSSFSSPLCNRALEQDICDRMSSCHWVIGEEAVCEWNDDYDTTTLPGCCMLLDESAASIKNGWDEQCRSYWTQKVCETPYTAEGEQRCYWTVTEEFVDCSLLWPTSSPTELPTEGFQRGCCRSDTPKWSSKCIVSHFEEHCENLSECHWVFTDDMSDCEWPSTTEVPEPGCCYANDQAAYSNDGRWIEACKDFWTEENCLRAIDPYDQTR